MENHSNGGIRIFVKGIGGDLGAMIPPGRGEEDVPGQDVPDRFAESDLTIRFEESDGVSNWLAELESGTTSTSVVDFQPEIVMVSIEPEIDSLGEPESEHVQHWMEQVTRTVGLIKEKTGANLFWLNNSTVEPGYHVSNYHGLSPEPRSLRVQRLSLALVGLSHELGISVIDVDRVLAEQGIEAITDPERRATVVREEIFRVLEDYGYFDERPIAVQVGQQKKGGS